MSAELKQFDSQFIEKLHTMSNQRVYKMIYRYARRGEKGIVGALLYYMFRNASPEKCDRHEVNATLYLCLGHLFDEQYFKIDLQTVIMILRCHASHIRISKVYYELVKIVNPSFYGSKCSRKCLKCQQCEECCAINAYFKCQAHGNKACNSCLNLMDICGFGIWNIDRQLIEPEKYTNLNVWSRYIKPHSIGLAKGKICLHLINHSGLPLFRTLFENNNSNFVKYEIPPLREERRINASGILWPLYQIESEAEYEIKSESEGEYEMGIDFGTEFENESKYEYENESECDDGSPLIPSDHESSDSTEIESKKFDFHNLTNLPNLTNFSFC